jgi:hypothetical protein
MNGPKKLTVDLVNSLKLLFYLVSLVEVITMNFSVTIVKEVSLINVENVLKGTTLIDQITHVDLVKMDVKDVLVLQHVMSVKKELSNLFKKIVNSEMLELLVIDNNAPLELYQVFLLLFTKILKSL